MEETIFAAENERYRLTVTVALEDDASFADLEPEVTVKHVTRDEYVAVRDFDPDVHAKVRYVVAFVLKDLDVDTVSMLDDTDIDIHAGTYEHKPSGGPTFDISTDYGRMFVLFDGREYVIGEVSDPADYGDFERFKAHCRALFNGEIGVYYVKATVWERCGSCATWHHVTDDSIGYVVDTPDTATWQEVAHNALHAAGLPVDTFNLKA